jgi:hypothetical protein
MKLAAFGVTHNDAGISIISKEVLTVNCQM